MAVFDEQGVILYINDSWVNFGRANGLDSEYDWLGGNYLATCLGSTEHGDGDGAAVYTGIRAVIAGQISSFSYEYPCHSPNELR
ncbi:MAG: hypothetical protein WAU60_08650 [Candidatus Competibacter denitrificans]|jgi:hypothetical protein